MIIVYPRTTIKIRCFLITPSGGALSSIVKMDLKMTVVKEFRPVEIVDKVALYYGLIHVYFLEDRI